MVLVSDFITQLENITLAPQSSQYRPIQLGGQDFSHCCRQAVEQSFEIQNGNLSLRNPSYITFQTPRDFFDAVAVSQPPCGATYTGSSSGAPEVKVPYSWCANQCNGWQISHYGVPLQWIGPMVGYILPCIAFCLSTPRSSKIGIPSMVFRPRPNHTMGLLTSVVRFPLALTIVALDTAVWLSVCFAFAGPMLLSGLYEAYLDHQLLAILDKRVRIDSRRTPKLTVHLRARLLTIILIGNIKMKTSGHVAEIDELISNISLSSSSINITAVKARLQALLASQTSFGSAVGAPVVFFVGAFIYNLIDIRSRLGDEDTAHALAFGIWWMIVPQLAIVSCLLLAANNPTTLHGVLGRPIEQDRNLEERPLFRCKPLTIFRWEPIEDAYGGRYKTVNLWSRGLNKYKWFRRVIDSYKQDLNVELEQEQVDQVESIDRELRMTFSDWFRSWCGAVFLLLVPCLLAMLTSYYTPRVGFSCRSLTHLVYFATQVPLMTIWLIHTWLEVHIAEQGQFQLNQSRRIEGLQAFMHVVLWIAILILGGGAVFSSIGGTLMQLTGVYRNCLCKIPAQYWLNREDQNAYVILSTNTAEQISEASTWWESTAISAATVLCAVCAFGWWHQRRLRAMFGDLVELIDMNPSFSLRKPCLQPEAS